MRSGLTKIKASALQFAILVSVIVAVLLSSFILFTYTHRLFGLQSASLINSIENSQDGILYSLNAKSTLPDTLTLLTENNTTHLEKLSWGGFLMIKSNSTTKTKSFSKIALTGARPEIKPMALQMAERQLPLVIVGNTKLEGDVYGSVRGVKAGVISGHYFNGDQLVSGDIKVGEETLPKLDSTWFETTKSWITDFPLESFQQVQLEKEIRNSFFNPIQLVYSNNSIILENTIIGNIIIYSSTEIQVAETAILKDILLIAPKITVQENFKGNIHLLASSQIKLEKNVLLSYPSSLTLMDSNKDENKIILEGEEPIFLSENSTMNGTIIYLPNESLDQTSNVSVTLKPESLITGQVYCMGNLEVNGTIQGSVYTQRFIYNGFGSKYINHIYDGQILAKDLSPDFCGLPFENKQKGIVQWLY